MKSFFKTLIPLLLFHLPLSAQVQVSHYDKISHWQNSIYIVKLEEGKDNNLKVHTEIRDNELALKKESTCDISGFKALGSIQAFFYDSTFMVIVNGPLFGQRNYVCAIFTKDLALLHKEVISKEVFTKNATITTIGKEQFLPDFYNVNYDGEFPVVENYSLQLAENSKQVGGSIAYCYRKNIKEGEIGYSKKWETPIVLNNVSYSRFFFFDQKKIFLYVKTLKKEISEAHIFNLDPESGKIIYDCKLELPDQVEVFLSNCFYDKATDKLVGLIDHRKFKKKGLFAAPDGYCLFSIDNKGVFKNQMESFPALLVKGTDETWLQNPVFVCEKIVKRPGGTFMAVNIKAAYIYDALGDAKKCFNVGAQIIEFDDQFNIIQNTPQQFPVFGNILVNSQNYILPLDDYFISHNYWWNELGGQFKYGFYWNEKDDKMLVSLVNILHDRTAISDKGEAQVYSLLIDKGKATLTLIDTNDKNISDSNSGAITPNWAIPISESKMLLQDGMWMNNKKWNLIVK